MRVATVYLPLLSRSTILLLLLMLYITTSVFITLSYKSLDNGKYNDIFFVSHTKKLTRRERDSVLINATSHPQHQPLSKDKEKSENEMRIGMNINSLNDFLPGSELMRYNSVPAASFVPDRPHTVVLLSYQRSGSSFIADWLFGNRADVFYLYEPLDSVYQAMYGVGEGWTIPADVTTHLNGSLRLVGEEERKAVQSFMRSIFSCDVTSLPKSVFLHKYALSWRKIVPHMEEYENCSRPVAKGSACPSHIQHMCGRRFTDSDLNKHCQNMLWRGKMNSSSAQQVQTVDSYHACLDEDMEKMSGCTPLLEKACTSSGTRVVKTVRGTMDELEPLLISDPNFRVLHLYRDPRAVYLSRKIQTWTWSAYEGLEPSAQRTAKVYCQTVMHDYKKRKELQRKYPGKIRSIVYDNFMMDPVKARKEIYTFLGMSDHPNSQNGTEEKTGKRKVNPRKFVSQKWKYRLNNNDMSDIEEACQSFADLVGVRWRK